MNYLWYAPTFLSNPSIKECYLQITIIQPFYTICDSGKIQTYDPQIRNLLLYSLSYGTKEQLAGLEPALFHIGSVMPYLLGDSCVFG